MATEQATEPLSVQDLTVVDLDSHTGPWSETLLEYLDRGDPARRMIENAGHVNSEILTKTRASPAFPNTPAGDDDPARSGAGSVAGKLAYMDEFGIDHSVLTPGSAVLATINHDQTAVSWMRATNDYLLDRWVDADDRITATMCVVNHRPDLAAEEVDRMAVEDDVVGVQMPGAGLIPPAGHRMYDPIYEAAQDHGLPIRMHSADQQGAITFPVQFRWAETFTESHAFTFPVESMWHLISMVCNGVPERFPDLEFVLQEPGFEWLPWMMWRLDDHYLQNSEDLPLLRKRPSEYIRDQFYVTTQPLGHTETTRYLGWTAEMAGGAETLLYASDHPHPDFDPPEEVLRPLRPHLEEADLRGIMGETAIEVFEL
jgi:hypothetical protein